MNANRNNVRVATRRRKPKPSREAIARAVTAALAAIIRRVRP